MTHRPLAWSALAFIAGILIEQPHLPAAGWARLGMAALAGSALLAAASSCRATLRLAGWLAFAGFLCAGRLAGIASETPGPYALAILAHRHEALLAQGVELAGRVASAPRSCRHPDPSRPCLEMDVDVRRVRLVGRRMPVSGLLRLRVSLDPSARGAPARGDGIETFARLLPARGGRERGGGAGSRPADGIQARGWVKSPLLLRRTPSIATRSWTARLAGGADHLRADLLERLRGCFSPGAAGSRAAGVAEALLLGERRGIDPADLVRLQEAGLSHLLAVSGFNVGVLAVLALGAARAAGAGPRASAGAAVPALVLYWMLNRDESSVARAVLMAIIWLAGRLIWRRADPFGAMGLAAIVLAARAPWLARDAGFQLTFAATWSLIVVARIPRGRPGAEPRRPWGRLAATVLVTALSATLAASAATLPLTIAHFNRVVPGALPANLVAGPLAAAAFVGTLAIVAAQPAAPRAAALAARFVTLCVEATFHAADLVRAAPGMTYRRPAPSAALSGLYYGGLALALARRRRPTREAGLLLTGFATTLLLLPLDTRAAPGGLRVTMLDVGQGDAILLEAAAGARLLLDAGGTPRGSYDAGERIVGPALWEMGIARLDAFVLTHADQDHAGGAAAVVGAFRPREVWLGAGARDGWNGRAAAGRLLAAAAARGARVRELARGDVVCLRGACVRALHPEGDGSGGLANEESLVLIASSSGRRVLLTGDAGVATESEIGPLLTRCDLLKVGHHGSRGSTSPALLARVAPRIALISCGRQNRFGHPHAEVLSRLAAAGAWTCRTDRDGSVTVELRGGATRLGSACAGAAAVVLGRPGGRPARSQIGSREGARDEADDQDREGDERDGAAARGEGL